MSRAMKNLDWIGLSLVAVLAASLGCGDDSGGSGGESSTGDVGSTSGDGSTSMAESTGAADSSGGAEESSTGEPAPLDGQAAYAAMCAPCHGAEGEGVAEFGYELRHPTREHATWVIRNGRPGDEFENSAMAPYSTDALSDAQLTEIYDWLDSFDQPTDGEGLYLDYCRNCHGVDGQGGVVGEGVVGKPASEIMQVVRSGENTADPGNRTAYMPAFGTDRISDAELQLIIDYIATL